jgi:hypothetical protein
MNRFLYPDIPQEVLLDFMVTFSRFEFALKRGKFIEGGRDGQIRVQHSAFARQISGEFSHRDGADLAEAIGYFRRNPPKRQIVTANGELGWEDNAYDGVSDQTVWLLSMVKTVRNNLFHGGKYWRGPVEDCARNCLLLSAAITILRNMVDCSPDIMESYFGN